MASEAAGECSVNSAICSGEVLNSEVLLYLLYTLKGLNISLQSMFEAFSILTIYIKTVVLFDFFEGVMG